MIDCAQTYEANNTRSRWRLWHTGVHTWLNSCGSKRSVSRPSKYLICLQLATHPVWRHMHVLLAAKHSGTVNWLEEERWGLLQNCTCSACSLVLSSSWVLLAVSTDSFTRAGKKAPTQEAGTSNRSRKVSKASTAVTSSLDCKACWVTCVMDNTRWLHSNVIQKIKALSDCKACWVTYIQTRCNGDSEDGNITCIPSPHDAIHNKYWMTWHVELFKTFSHCLPTPSLMNLIDLKMWLNWLIDAKNNLTENAPWLPWMKKCSKISQFWRTYNKASKLITESRHDLCSSLGLVKMNVERFCPFWTAQQSHLYMQSKTSSVPWSISGICSTSSRTWDSSM